MNFLSINIKGLGSVEKARWISKLKKEEDISFLVIKETMLEDPKELEVAKFWGKTRFEWD